MEGLASGSVWTHEAEDAGRPAVVVAVAAFSLQLAVPAPHGLGLWRLWAVLALAYRALSSLVDGGRQHHGQGARGSVLAQCHL